MTDFIPVNTPLLIGNEKKYLCECIESGWISSEGPFVSRFESELASFTSRKHAISVTNGTVALDLAIEALGLKAGDEIILPSFTIISCVNAILRLGLVPKFVDCDIDTFNFNINGIKEALSTSTKAIMVVHIFGLSVDIDPIIQIAKEHSLYVIEDAAEVIGQTYKGKMCGSFGDISTMSFYPNKHITTGEGGAVFTNNDELAAKIRSLKNLCFQSDKRFIHESLGTNARMTNMQAAIGLAQLEQIDKFIEIKRSIGSYYIKKFMNIRDLKLPTRATQYCDNIYWVFPLVLSSIEIKVELQNFLNASGVGTRPFFYPLNLQPLLPDFGLEIVNNCPNAKFLYDHGFYIPSGLGLSSSDQKRVSSLIIKFFK